MIGARKRRIAVHFVKVSLIRFCKEMKKEKRKKLQLKIKRRKK